MRPSQKTSIWLSLIATMCAVLGGCGFVQTVMKDVGVVDKSVGGFHDQLNSADFHGIYASTDDGFRKSASEARLTALLDAVHRKMGKVTSANRGNYRENWDTTWGKTVTVSYTTHFEGGDASEDFVYRFNGDRPLLLHYNINSDALITK